MMSYVIRITLFDGAMIIFREGLRGARSICPGGLGGGWILEVERSVETRGDAASGRIIDGSLARIEG